MAVRKVTTKIVKLPDGSFAHSNPAKLSSQLDSLAPGIYVVTWEKESTSVARKKKFYFVMESGLAKHLGYTKTELHEALKDHIGQITGDDGKPSYESIADVKTDDRMMERIFEFQQFASLNFNYKCENYVEDGT